MPPHGWGPRQRRGAFTLSFDNLGEAAALQRGEAVDPAAIGRHETALVVLPELLRVLQDLSATYFVEACNAELYPDQLLAWQNAGHEVALHGWRHEHWSRLDAHERPVLLQRCMDAFERVGIVAHGFRPPGGVLSPAAQHELRAAGLRYASAFGAPGASRVDDEGLVLLPFTWQHVDAFMLDPSLGELRRRHDHDASPASLVEWQAALRSALNLAVKAGCHVTAIFHPYLLAGDAPMFDVLRAFVDTLRQADDLWVASCADVARWLQRES